MIPAGLSRLGTGAQTPHGFHLAGTVPVLGVIVQRGYDNSLATPCYRSNDGENCVL